MSPQEFKLQKAIYKSQLHAVLKSCEFNGAGMRELIGEFTDEVLGS